MQQVVSARPIMRGEGLARVLVIFGRNFRRLALAAGYDDQVELAKLLKVSQSTVSEWWNGLRLPRPDRFDAICKLFKCTHAELLSEGVVELVPISIEDAAEEVLDVLQSLRRSTEDIDKVIDLMRAITAKPKN